MRNPVSNFTYAKSDIDIKRSIIDRTHDHKTTLSAGLLYPIYVDEYIPGDTFEIDLSSLIRMSTPIFPVMDNCYLDVYFFAVPNRIIWDHWKEFMGESPEDPYLDNVQYSIPQLVNPYAGQVTQPAAVPAKSILDYMGIPSNTVIDSVSALPVRAYCKIWNEWFRDQNLQNAINLDTGDSDLHYAWHAEELGEGPWPFWNYNKEGSDAFILNAQHGGDLAPVAKYHDYFTSALLEPQKGDPVAIPLNGFAPVYASSLINMTDDYLPFDSEKARSITALKMKSSDYPLSGDGYADYAVNGGAFGGLPYYQSGEAYQAYTQGVTSDPVKGTPSNLVADLGAHQYTSTQAGLAYSTISDLRYAFQIQKLLEADNRYGTRYTEIIKGHFQVDSPDGLLQRPEFLGGKRIPINITQVLQTSATNDVSPQGNTAAYSLTGDRFQAFSKSFTEHGWILGLACIRTDHTYQQGIDKMFSRKDRYDFYFPELANISEQPIYNKEIFNTQYVASGAEIIPTPGIFGYQEAWAEYRFKPNRISGEFRSTYPQSLDSWHYGDAYGSQPYLSDEWIRETRRNIDRTLAVQSSEADQFIADFYFRVRSVRPIPMYSIPGLADHH